ncbi:MAG: hypothetical protein GXO22_04000 [Aquificae bacterium]|nr:hypothetical protein [Aquificota bacterium]
MKIDKNQTKEKLQKSVINMIQLGWRSGQIKIGYTELEKASKKGEKGFIIIATDIAQRTKRHIFRVFNGDCFEIFTKEELGQFLGKKTIGVIFVKENKFGLKLKNLIKQYLQLEGGNSSCQ